MENIGLTTLLASHLVGQFPTVLVCTIACAIILTKKDKIAAAPHYALWGFGLAIGLGLVMPLLTIGLQVWIMRFAGPTSQNYVRLMAILNIVTALLHAATYGLLLMAMLAPAKSKERAQQD
jgi:hypothetical protein